MILPTERPRDPRDWPPELKLAYAMDRAEKLIDRSPVIAEVWLKEVDRLTALIKNCINTRLDNTDTGSVE